MQEAGPAVLFAGDLDDPWVAGIAASLPSSTRRLHTPGDLPEVWPGEADVVVLHRPHLTGPDFDRLRRLKASRKMPPRVVLCVGPHARYADVQRWSGLVDSVLPEATAPEVIARHALPDRERRMPGDPPRVAVVSGLRDLRMAVADSVAAAGYPPIPTRDWDEAPPADLAVWDVPVLEYGWPDELERQSASRRIITLIGFADRDLVALAHSRGASACLDLPFDPLDLAFVLDRLAGRRAVVEAHPPHALPPTPAARRSLPGRREVVDPGGGS